MILELIIKEFIVKGVTSEGSPSTTSLSPSSSEATRPPYRMVPAFEEKIDSLSCDLPLLPSQYRIWKGNETHELLLPITVSVFKRDFSIISGMAHVVAK